MRNMGAPGSCGSGRRQQPANSSFPYPCLSTNVFHAGIKMPPLALLAFPGRPRLEAQSEESPRGTAGSATYPRESQPYPRGLRHEPGLCNRVDIEGRLPKFHWCGQMVDRASGKAADSAPMQSREVSRSFLKERLGRVRSRQRRPPGNWDRVAWLPFRGLPYITFNPNTPALKLVSISSTCCSPLGCRCIFSRDFEHVAGVAEYIVGAGRAPAASWTGSIGDWSWRCQ